MNITIKKYTSIFILGIAFFTSCSKGGSGDSKKGEGPEEPILVLPGKALGLLPANAETCAEFQPVEGHSDKATISFSWSAAEHATSYFLEVFDADTAVGNTTVSSTTAELTLEKGKTYSWTITAKNADGEMQSNTFSFITPGEAIGNFAPYAAEITMVLDQNNSELKVSWVGSDEDGDSLSYDVEVKEGDYIIEELEGISELELEPIITIDNTTYTVQVKSNDGFGNFSISTQTLNL